MHCTRVLVLEDERPIRRMLCTALERAGFQVCESADTTEARRCLKETPVDVALVDWMLPGESGIAFLGWLRREPELRALPVILVTARGTEGDKLSAFEAGADDYVTKPFSMAELTARIRAVRRRAGAQGAASRNKTKVGPLELDADAFTLHAGGRPVRLGRAEFRLLQALMDEPGRVWTRAQLLDRAWSVGADVGERTVDVHILRLRKALAPSGCDRMIETVRGVGYRLARPTAS